MDYKQFATVVKAAPGGDPRVLRFIGSNESVDRDGDIIDLDGWDVADYMKNPVFLWAHDYSSPPIGKTVRIEKDRNSRALMFDVRFPTVAELAPDGYPSEHALMVETLYNLYKGGYLSATSVGFQSKTFERRNDNGQDQLPEWQRGMHITGAALMELSGCPVPANPQALIQARSAQGIDTKSLQVIEDQIKLEVTPKSGARLSAKTLETLATINEQHDIISRCMREATDAHAKASQCLKDLMDMPEEPAADDGKAVLTIVEKTSTQ